MRTVCGWGVVIQAVNDICVAWSVGFDVPHVLLAAEAQQDTPGVDIGQQRLQRCDGNIHTHVPATVAQQPGEQDINNKYKIIYKYSESYK